MEFKKNGTPPTSQLHKLLDEKIDRLILERLGNDTYTIGRDPYLEITAKALGMTYEDAVKKHSARQPSVRAMRSEVKNKMLSYAHGLTIRKF